MEGCSGSATKGIHLLLPAADDVPKSTKMQIISIGYDRRLNVWECIDRKTETQESDKYTEGAEGKLGTSIHHEFASGLDKAYQPSNFHLKWIGGRMCNIGDIGSMFCTQSTNDSTDILVVGEGWQVLKLKMNN